MGDEAEMSARLVQIVRELLIRHPEFRCISLFSALPREPDLRVLVELMPDRLFVFPSIRKDVMEFHHIRDLSELELSTWGILEPKANAEIIDPTKIDLLLCPGLAFTQSGHRLGKGKGYYDRYLARYNQERPTCYGVTFSAFVCKSIPCETHDIRMDRVLDETTPLD